MNEERLESAEDSFHDQRGKAVREIGRLLAVAETKQADPWLSDADRAYWRGVCDGLACALREYDGALGFGFRR